MDKEVKEQSQVQELQQMVDAWSSLQRYAFYVGTSRGVLSSLNTICLKYIGMSFEQYQKALVKPQLNTMVSVSQCMALLLNLLKSIDELVNAAMTEAQKDVQKEKENEKTVVDNSVAQ